MMVDWVTAKIPFYAPGIISGGSVISLTPDGEIERETTKRLSVGGSYESSITLRTFNVDSDRNTSVIEFSGNPVKFLQGHNIFGSHDLPNITYAAALKVSSLLGINQPQTIRNQWHSGAGTVSRVDLNEMYDLGSRQATEAFLYHLADSCRTRSQSAVVKGSTVYMNKTSKRWSFKAYSKGQEINLARNNKRGMFEFSDQLKDWVDGMLRLELTLKSNELRETGYFLLKNWINVECVKLFDTYYERIAMSTQNKIDILDLPRALKLTYTAWSIGEDVRAMLPRTTFYRHRKELLAYGIDISVSAGVSRPDYSNVVPFVREIVLKPAEIPTWAYEQDLVYKPLRFV